MPTGFKLFLVTMWAAFILCVAVAVAVAEPAKRSPYEPVRLVCFNEAMEIVSLEPDRGLMTREEMLAMLRAGKVREWNSYRKANLDALVDLSGADLRHAWLVGANFAGVNLAEAHLDDARLEGADLSGADLSGAYFNWAHLQKAMLTNSVLTRAHFYNADLESAEFSGSVLTSTEFYAARNMDLSFFLATNLWAAKGLPQRFRKQYIAELVESWR